MIKIGPKWSIYVIMWFRKRISDIKFAQNHDKLSFSTVFIAFHSSWHKTVQNRCKMIWNNQKWSKMVQNGSKWSIYVIMWFKKWISDIKFPQNHDKLSFPILFIDFDIIRDPKRFKINLKWSEMIKNDLAEILISLIT